MNKTDALSTTTTCDVSRIFFQTERSTSITENIKAIIATANVHSTCTFAFTVSYGRIFRCMREKCLCLRMSLKEVRPPFLQPLLPQYVRYCHLLPAILSIKMRIVLTNEDWKYSAIIRNCSGMRSATFV